MILNKNSDDDNNKSFSTGPRFVSKPRGGQKHEFYLSGYIDEPSEYVDWFNIIRSASPDDAIHIYINSGGGRVSTALQFLRVMADCPGEITCSIEGECMSAATIIFLAGDYLEVTPNAMFMIHNYSGGSFGKGGEMHDHIMFERQWSVKLFRDIYKDFLTDSEINLMLDGKDYWFDSDEVIRRVQAFVTKRESESTKVEEDYMQQTNAKKHTENVVASVAEYSTTDKTNPISQPSTN